MRQSLMITAMSRAQLKRRRRSRNVGEQANTRKKHKLRSSESSSRVTPGRKGSSRKGGSRKGGTERRNETIILSLVGKACSKCANSLEQNANRKDIQTDKRMKRHVYSYTYISYILMKVHSSSKY